MLWYLLIAAIGELLWVYAYIVLSIVFAYGAISIFCLEY
jgi:hypothetical protein